jgi:hypothetical protein
VGLVVFPAHFCARSSEKAGTRWKMLRVVGFVLQVVITHDGEMSWWMPAIERTIHKREDE